MKEYKHGVKWPIGLMDTQFLIDLLHDTKIMITDKNGNTFLIDQGNIKPVLKNDDKSIK